MTDRPLDASDTDDRLGTVLADCLEAVDRGEADWPGLLARYPEFAGELNDLFVGQERVEKLAAPLRPAALAAQLTSTPELSTTSPLGDFHIIRQVGRGGMGLVYEAEQVSLGRRVALKVLPFAATMDPKQLQRFKNEAQAAAHLHHQNIVPVHYVGCERGIHFYAMQYIEGQTLATAIEQLRLKSAPASRGPLSLEETRPYQGADAPRSPASTPSADTAPIAGLSTANSRKDAAYFRTVAQLGIQAAEALDYAHQMGVIHRDVKPANLMVDATGRLWVTDFGLAQIQSDPRLTMTGDLVGTLRYMSPEQALAKRVVVDHRTDVYSLGATLYELLTLEPAYTGQDRQELLRQIAFEEPKPPRRVNKAIPTELETIVLKALEKNPAERYATAQELADDLRHFLEDRPILARRPPLRMQLARWVRRHKPLVAAVAAALLMGTAVLGASIGWLARDRATRRVKTEGVTEAGLLEVARLQEQGRVPEAHEAARRLAGLLERDNADAALRRRVDARVTDLALLERLENVRLEMTVMEGRTNSEAADRLYRAAFRDAGLDVETLPDEEAGACLRQTTVAVELAAALDHWALLRRRIQGPRGNGWQGLLAVARQADPDDERGRVREALRRMERQSLVDLVGSVDISRLSPPTVQALSIAIIDTGEGRPAEALLREARRRRPDDFWVNFHLGYVLGDGPQPRLEEAVRYYTAAAALRPHSPIVLHNLGVVLKRKGDADGAIAAYREAICRNEDYASAHNGLGAVLQDLRGDSDGGIIEFRKALRLKPDFPEARRNLGVALRAKGDVEGAIAAFREALHLNKDYPEAHFDLGAMLNHKGDPEGAIAEFREAIRLRKDYAEPHWGLGAVLFRKGDIDGSITQYRAALRLKKDYAEAHNDLGVAMKQKGEVDNAIAEFKEAIGLKKNYAEAHLNLGAALSAKGLLEEAIVEYREAIRLKKDFVAAHNNLGVELRRKGDVDGAIAEFREALRLNKGDSDVHNNLGIALQNNGDLDGAIAEYRETLRLKEDCPEAHCNLGGALESKGRFAEALVHRRRGHELGSKRPGWPYPSGQWVTQCERLVELDAKLPRMLKGELQPADVGERLALAQLCQLLCKSLYAAGARWYAEAFAASPPPSDRPIVQRYNAACCAVLAGCGQGQDADKLTTEERARLRLQSLAWLRAELAAWRKMLEKEPDKARPLVRQQMQHWQQDKDFAGVRGPEALAKLPEGERQDWRKLWEEVEGLAKRAALTQPELIPPANCCR
jgi:tetratricopeptide (TPR) repeat protein